MIVYCAAAADFSGSSPHLTAATNHYIHIENVVLAFHVPSLRGSCAIYSLNLANQSRTLLQEKTWFSCNKQSSYRANNHLGLGGVYPGRRGLYYIASLIFIIVSNVSVIISGV